MAALTPAPEGLRARRVSTARGPIEVADSGSGPAVLVVHGTPGDWRQAPGIAEDLSGSARVLLVSRPGYGRTPLRSGRSPLDQADLYAALLDALDLDTAVVVGISGGGPSAYAFAARHRHRCRGLLLCCAVTPHLMTLPRPMLRLAAVPGLWRAAAAGGRAVARVRPASAPDLGVLQDVERVLAQDPVVLGDLQRFEAERPATVRGGGLRNDVRALATRTQIPWVPGPDVPTVVLHGDADDVVPLSHGQAYAAAIPGARLQVLAGYGHGVPVFARRLVAELVRGLL